MVKTRDFKAVQKLMETSFATNPPHPDFPLPHIDDVLPLTEKEIQGIQKGFGEYGYPIIEPIARRPELVRLLIEKDPKVKYGSTQGTTLLGVLRVFEESSVKPGGYSITAATLINSEHVGYSAANRAGRELRNARKALASLYGFQFTNLSYMMQLAQPEDYHRSNEYHQLNMIKAGHRAAKLNAIAYTRGLLGDVETSRVSEDVVDVAIRGREIYDERYLLEPPTRNWVDAIRPPRHLL